MKDKVKYNQSDWENMAKAYSDEEAGEFARQETYDLPGDTDAERKWRNIRLLSQTDIIDVEGAWEKLSARIEDSKESSTGKLRLASFKRVIQAAAAVIILAVSATLVYYTVNSGFLKKTIVVTTNDYQINHKVSLPDGSTLYLNRNSEVSYNRNFKSGRGVKLTGEAYFNITHDPSKPFTVDAGSASIKVLGTTFNVIAGNNDTAVEVYVTSGKVLLTGRTDSPGLLLDPGYIGTAGSGAIEKKLNTDPNYLAWNTGALFYENERLEVVFADLKRAFNINIKVDDLSILEESWTSTISKMQEETIIQLICFSFNMSYVKEGEVYHLSKK